MTQPRADPVSSPAFENWRHFASDGAICAPAAAVDCLAAIEAAIAPLQLDQAGLRLHATPLLSSVLDAATGEIGVLAGRLMGRPCQAVRAVLFDKSAATNWALGWHQDRTIVVREKIETPGFANWNSKAGLLHVEPPIALLERMLTLRIHLDPVPFDNAPLLIAPGSHTLGRIPVHAISDTIARCGIRACMAERGDVWVYATTILHASERALRPKHRRVLQVDYSSDDLPNGLQWLAI